MQAKDVAKAVIKGSGLSMTEVAERCGKANAANIGMFLQSKSMRVDNFLMIMNACGYDLVARSRDGTKPEYIIGDDDAKRVQVTYDETQIRGLVKSIMEDELATRRIFAPSSLRIAFAEEPEPDLDTPTPGTDRK